LPNNRYIEDHIEDLQTTAENVLLEDKECVVECL